MASLARFHLRLLQSWLPVRSSVWAFIVSLLQRCLHTGVVKGYTVSVSHFPPFKRVVFAHASAQANRRRMDPQSSTLPANVSELRQSTSPATMSSSQKRSDTLHPDRGYIGHIHCVRECFSP